MFAESEVGDTGEDYKVSQALGTRNLSNTKSEAEAVATWSVRMTYLWLTRVEISFQGRINRASQRSYGEEVGLPPLCLLKVAIVPDDFPCQQHVLNAGARANVMNNQVMLVGLCRNVCEDADVLDAFAEFPRHHVSR